MWPRTARRAASLIGTAAFAAAKQTAGASTPSGRVRQFADACAAGSVPASRGASFARYVAQVPSKERRGDNAEAAAIIRQSGKLLIGDFYHRPEGLVALGHIIGSMNMKRGDAIYLEQGVSEVLDNVAFMAWMAANPQASPEDIAAEVDRLFPPGERAPRIETLVDEGRTPEEAAAWHRQWLNMEAAIAQQVVRRGITVRTLFTSNRPNVNDASFRRKLDEQAWAEFQQGQGLRVILAGENHCIAGSFPGDEETYQLLEKSGGVFLRTAHSFQNEERLRPFLQQAYFFKQKPAPLGVWKATMPSPDAGGYEVEFTLYRSGGRGGLSAPARS